MSGHKRWSEIKRTPPRKSQTALDNLWQELVMDALASDGPIADRDVKNAIAHWRPRIEAEAAGAPLREALDPICECGQGCVMPHMHRNAATPASAPCPHHDINTRGCRLCYDYHHAPAPLDMLDVDALAEALLAWFPKQAFGNDTDVRMAADHITAEYARLIARAAAKEDADAS